MNAPIRAQALLHAIGGTGNYRRPGLAPATSDPSAVYSVAVSQRRPEFQALLLEWKRATARHSSPSAIVKHPTGQALIVFLQQTNAIDLVIEELRQKPGVLVFIMETLTGLRPYQGLRPGDMTAMSQRWIDWYLACPVPAAAE